MKDAAVKASDVLKAKGRRRTARLLVVVPFVALPLGALLAQRTPAGRTWLAGMGSQISHRWRQTVGKSQAMTFNVQDMNALVADLMAKGVTFTQEPDPQPWGTYAMIRDSEGNQLILVEPPSNPM